jgi:hypothetical protein
LTGRADGIRSEPESTYHIGVIDESAIRQRFEALAPVLGGRGLRGLATITGRAGGGAVTCTTNLARLIASSPRDPYINDWMKDALASNEPAIFVDTKKKELVSDFKNPGRKWGFMAFRQLFVINLQSL